MCFWALKLINSSLHISFWFTPACINCTLPYIGNNAVNKIPTRLQFFPCLLTWFASFPFFVNHLYTKNINWNTAIMWKFFFYCTASSFGRLFGCVIIFIVEALYFWWVTYLHVILLENCCGISLVDAFDHYLILTKIKEALLVALILWSRAKLLFANKFFTFFFFF